MSGRRAALTIVPQFYPKGWRVLRPKEEIEKGDYFWSTINKCWMPAGKGKVGFLASKPHTYVRREYEA